jgi:hypothetical protein
MSDSEYKIKLALIILGYLLIAVIWAAWDVLAAPLDEYPRFLAAPRCGGAGVWIVWANPPLVIPRDDLETAGGTVTAHRTWGDSYVLPARYIGQSFGSYYYYAEWPLLESVFIGAGAWGLTGVLYVGALDVPIQSLVFECWSVWLPSVRK